MKKLMLLTILMGCFGFVRAEDASGVKVEDVEKDIVSLSEYLAQRKAFMEKQIVQEQTAIKSIEEELKAAKKFALIAGVKKFDVELNERTNSFFAGDSSKNLAALTNENPQDLRFMKKIQQLATKESQETLQNAQNMVMAHKVKFPAFK